MTALIIGDNLIRFHLPGLQRHAVSHILRVEVLTVADVVAQEHFRGGIHHLVDIRGACHPSLLTLIVMAIVQVDLRSVAVPKGIRHGGQDGVESRHIAVLELSFAVNGSIPPDHDFGRVEIIVHGVRALYGLQPPELCLAVVLLEKLFVCVAWESASSQFEQQGTFLFADAAGRAVSDFHANQRFISIVLIQVELLTQTGSTFGQCVPGQFS